VQKIERSFFEYTFSDLGLLEGRAVENAVVERDGKEAGIVPGSFFELRRKETDKRRAEIGKG
jgi:hypothetical protein